MKSSDKLIPSSQSPNFSSNWFFLPGSPLKISLCFPDSSSNVTCFLLFTGKLFLVPPAMVDIHSILTVLQYSQDFGEMGTGLSLFKLIIRTTFKIENLRFFFFCLWHISYIPSILIPLRFCSYNQIILSNLFSFWIYWI